MLTRLRRVLSRIDRRARPGATNRADVIDEHFVPSRGLALQDYVSAGDMCGSHHLAKYTWATAVLRDQPGVEHVLDAACGSGYGSYMLAGALPGAHVTGVDYDPGAVAAAAATYDRPNLVFRAGDVTRWDETIGDTVFDCIVSFDTLEHVAHRDIMMRYLVEHLSPSGMLLFSTPCGLPWDNLSPEWPAHKIEYSTSSLFDFLSRYFRTILRPDDGSLPHRAVLDAVNEGGVEYLLLLNPVICRDPIVIANPYARRDTGATTAHDGVVGATPSE